MGSWLAGFVPLEGCEGGLKSEAFLPLLLLVLKLTEIPRLSHPNLIVPEYSWYMCILPRLMRPFLVSAQERKSNVLGCLTL